MNDLADQLAQAYADGWRAGNGRDDKQTKTESNYREADDEHERCGTCTHYDAPESAADVATDAPSSDDDDSANGSGSDRGGMGTCSLVSGTIDSTFVCDLYDSDASVDVTAESSRPSRSERSRAPSPRD